ncbi:MAG: hypothetical protein QOE90_801 [Thermoplasmata archaeon]|jgi:hypothetical protein|nr:hypothetical protein [Thermoplasmata archaeon]
MQGQHVAEAPEWRACRVCAQRRQVDADGHFPEHRIMRERCPGSGQFVKRWDDQAARRAVSLVSRRWGA